jgi:hypothetical protein
MGQELTTLYSSLSSTPPPARGDVVFVVPLNLHLTARQMNEMVACGQQPGVPFSLTPEGVSRPSGNRAKVNFAENGVTLHRTSVKVFDEGGGMFSVSFKYDASCAAQVTVMIGNRDRTTAEVIKCDEPLIKWGPLPLGKGLNQEWSSKALGLFAKECMFPGRSRATGLGNDIHDIIISLSPSISFLLPHFYSSIFLIKMFHIFIMVIWLQITGVFICSKYTIPLLPFL